MLFSLTEKKIIHPILALRSHLPCIEQGQKTIWKAKIRQVMEAEFATRAIAVFASVFAAADAVIHFVTGAYKGGCLLARRVCCLSSLPHEKSLICAHFRSAVWFLGLALIGSLIGVIWPDFFKYCLSSESPPGSIAQGLAGFNNSRVRGQINGIYITTNETNLARTYQLVRTQPRPDAKIETIHIGCAGWYNFDIMSLRRSNYGLIMDFNPKNSEFIRKTIEVIKSCESRDSFKKAMLHYLNSLSGEARDLFFHKDQHELPPEKIEKEFSREGSWLHKEESYLYIKMLASTGRIIPVTEDITHSENFVKLRRFLDRNKLHIDTLYLSNICNFMDTSHEKSAFEKSVKQLLNKDTLFINCPKIICANTSHPIILSQRAVLGKEVLESNNPLQLFEETHQTSEDSHSNSFCTIVCDV